MDSQESFDQFYRNQIDNIMSDPRNRKMIEEHFKDNPEILKMVREANEAADINDQIVNVLGMAKLLLSRFDENNHSPSKAAENMEFFMNYMKITSIATDNLMRNVESFIERYRGDQNG